MKSSGQNLSPHPGSTFHCVGFILALPMGVLPALHLSYMAARLWRLQGPIFSTLSPVGNSCKALSLSLIEGVHFMCILPLTWPGVWPSPWEALICSGLGMIPSSPRAEHAARSRRHGFRIEQARGPKRSLWKERQWMSGR